MRDQVQAAPSNTGGAYEKRIWGAGWFGSFGIAGGLRGAGGGGFSGTVTVPSGFTVQGVEVVACFYQSSSDSCDGSKSKSVTLNASGRSAGFSIEGLAPGDYVILAAKQGLLGVLTDNQGNPALVRPPRSGISIDMVQVSAGSVPSPDHR